MNIGENIRKFRKAKGLKQNQLAEMAGMPIGTLANYELGYRETPLSIVELLATTLNITVPELLGYVTPTLEFTKPDISEFTTEELLKEIVRRIS